MAEVDKQFLLTYPNLDDSNGEVVLTNDHVVLQRLVVPAGEWEGIHSHPGNQIYVHIKGGEWSGLIGGKPEYSRIVDEDGAVGWMDAIPLSAGHDSGNTGDTPIDLIYVTLKEDAPIAPEIEHVAQIYPNIPLELLLENHRVIVQRVQVDPGQWTGVHSRRSAVVARNLHPRRFGRLVLWVGWMPSPLARGMKWETPVTRLSTLFWLHSSS